ncbi:mitogen-activated protein kinase kinase kinase 5-like [Xenopus laevis]|uniref:Mitogen-activated protein kinase kinase kinase 5-like n=1 Tax=Xenopus laevis TaxID=8355 RepID=A0A8J1M9J2_XENLA|nr:mitogen-activated protein kinase kinase kinase 5-like isoform X2 [Xenopus laevis]XP_041437720.1 mitogen-activated protein kinase kinase kinase 5-like [Xenopus laevis]
MSGNTDIPQTPVPYVSHDNPTDQELVNWLRELGATDDAVNQFVEEEYTLYNVLHDITKDDLKSLRLRPMFSKEPQNSTNNNRG